MRPKTERIPAARMSDSKFVLPSSFRDPHGFIFSVEGTLLRQINEAGRSNYMAAKESGLYQKLWDAHLLVPHSELGLEYAFDPTMSPAAVIRPERIPFISHPYEWSFSMLQAAALHTLRVQELALANDFTLRDASAFNIQFIHNRPIFIDTLSFEPLDPTKPWSAYGQFCRHFLAPLALMALVDLRLGSLLRDHIDGIPLDLAAKILGRKAWTRFHLLIHLGLHGKLSMGTKDRSQINRAHTKKLSRTSQRALIDDLKSAIAGLRLSTTQSVWSHYYAATNYSDAALEAKAAIVTEAIRETEPRLVWDLGCNTGHFSKLAADKGATTIGWDFDPLCIEFAYQQALRSQSKNILFLHQDLTTPSPALGWNLRERDSLIERGPADLVVALALVHHLVIGNNISIDRLVEFLRSISKYLLVEFVPKEDSQTQRLLASRLDVFTDYTLEQFKAKFEARCELIWEKPVPQTHRTLLLFKTR